MSDTFEAGTPAHHIAVGVCTALIVSTFFAARRANNFEGKKLRLIIGWGCVAVWIANTVLLMRPDRFHWSGSLPPHFCNLANLLGAIAVLQQKRLFQGILYFWALGLCIWAFITPTLGEGPALIGYWIFWAYHLFIGLAVAFFLGADRFRPTWSDLTNASLFTLGYLAVLFALNLITGWNYGFVGPSTPSSPTPVDALGPYPWRVLWMALLGAAIFTALWLPWHLAKGGTDSSKQIEQRRK